jgi:uncharacterized protein (DUF488 family)
MTPVDAIFTVGHSNRSFSEFAGVLRSADIHLLIDIRRFPASRRYPHFNAGLLRTELASLGIAYHHFPELGGYRESNESKARSPNDGWPAGFLRSYADYAMTEEFRLALERLLRTIEPGSALMCAEKSWTDCHRQIVADYLISSGRQVIHLVDATTRETGRLSPLAVAAQQGTIRYPAVRSQLRFDF